MRGTTITGLAVLLAAALPLSACGGTSSSGASTSTGAASTSTGAAGTSTTTASATATASGGSPSAVATAEQALAAISGPNGSFSHPPTAGPKGSPGKTIYVVTFGQSLPYFP